MPPYPLSKLTFGSFLAYSSHGQSDLSRDSRALRDRIKHDRESWTPGLSMLRYAAARLAEELENVPTLRELLDPQALLVPAPGHTPLPPSRYAASILWVPRRIAQELHQVSLGAAVAPILVRHSRIPKAAFAAPGERPTLDDHFNSLHVDPQIVDPPQAITVVDDFVTKGTTLLACATLLQNSYPDSVVRAFALVRTFSYSDVESIMDPVVGVIEPDSWGEARRAP